MTEKEQQFERIYEKTKDFGRTQFVREIQMQINDNKKKDEIIKQLKKQKDELEKENRRLKENYDRIYNENCKLREEHNITDISLLDENYKLKKQKDDVIEYIKNRFDADKGIWIIDCYDLLRMLGETNG